MKNEQFCPQLSTYFKETWDLGARGAGETETTQENIQDWLEPDEGNPRFQPLTKEEIVAVIFFISFVSTIYILNFLFFFSKFFFVFYDYYCFINPD
jgi:hypothetical protein